MEAIGPLRGLGLLKGKWPLRGPLAPLGAIEPLLGPTDALWGRAPYGANGPLRGQWPAKGANGPLSGPAAPQGANGPSEGQRPLKVPMVAIGPLRGLRPLEGRLAP